MREREDRGGGFFLKELEEWRLFNSEEYFAFFFFSYVSLFVVDDKEIILYIKNGKKDRRISVICYILIRRRIKLVLLTVGH